MGKGEISWKGKDDQGEPRQICAHKFGDTWRFYIRARRYDNWQPLDNPPFDDWLELLDGVRRRIGRRLLRPEEEERVCRMIRERYPEKPC